MSRLLSGCLLAGLLVTTAATAAVPTVRTGNGLLAGKTDDAALAYLGIPYAAAPIGANRWRAPQPAASWTGVREALAFGHSCMQTPFRGPPGQNKAADTTSNAAAKPPADTSATGSRPSRANDPGFSEDCLFLNVWTPDATPKTRLPVLVFFHGGGWNSGSGSSTDYAGASMAGHGIVMVTVNFRLGVFGFLANPWLLDEAGDTGNYGLMDQVAALEWVKHNIAAFGGDPDRVTIAGQSSGAAAVRDLASIPAATGLFQRVIAESTPFRGGGPIPLSEALERGQRFTQAAHAGSLADLRAMSADAVQKLVPGGLPRENKMGFLPVSGDRFFPANARQRQNLAMIAGSNSWENRMSGIREWTVNDTAGLQKMLQNHFKDSAALFAPLYQPALYGGSINAAAHAILADGPAAEVALRQHARDANAAPVYTYLWTRALPGDVAAFHASELTYAYANLDRDPRHTYTAADHAISDKLNAYWVNFIKTGDPNGPGLPHWPEARSGLTMELGDHFTPRRMFSADKLAAYRTYADHGGQFGLP